MAHVIKTVMTYPLNGTTTDFNIPFEYLARKFIVVTLLGRDRKVLTLNTDYRFATKTTISLSRAWGPADQYNMIEIRRYTSATERLVDFTDGSILRAYDLNVAQLQTIHVAEEARDLTADTIGVNNDGDLDARFRKIVNLAAAENDSDAINFGQVKQMSQGAWQSREEALRFRNEAEQFRNAASTSATNAKASETAAKNAQSAASGSQTAAKTSETNARASQTAAAASQAAAKTSETNAKNSENAAKTAATNAKNSEAGVKASATAAKTSETNAKASETAAKASQTAAKTSETNAKASQTAVAEDRKATGLARNDAQAAQAAAAESAKQAENSRAAAATSQTGAASEAERAMKWASNPKGQAVTTGKYSALHYAEVAKEEASKLANWNLLGAAIDKVEGTTVTWKGIQVTPRVKLSTNAFINSTEVRLDNPILSTNTRSYIRCLNLTTETNKRDNVLQFGDSVGWYFYAQRADLEGKGPVDMNVNGTLKATALTSSGNLSVTKNTTLTGDLNVAGKTTLNGDISFRGSLRSNNNIIIDAADKKFAAKGDAQTVIYTYALAGMTRPNDSWVAKTDYKFQGAAMEFGIVRGPGNEISQGLLRVTGVLNGTSKDWGFYADGRTRIPGALDLTNARILVDGNIQGGAWGDSLHQQVNNKVTQCRRGANQYVRPGDMWQDYGVPDGYIVGFHNTTGDGNLRYSGFYYRVPQFYSPAGGWQNFLNDQ